jgi:hypothetical protein
MTEIFEKRAVMEVDFQNDLVIMTTKSVILPDGKKTIPRYGIDPSYKERFLAEVVGDFWHTENDQLQALIFYNDKTCFCQRKKLKFNFETKLNYWQSYSFNGFTEDQVVELQSKIAALVETTLFTNRLKIVPKLEEVEKEFMFFDQYYAKRLRERNVMLKSSDWRILPDVVDSYPGEKDLWIKWRQEIRNLVMKEPTEYETPLEFFKSIRQLKWPVDPKFYREQYPDGVDVNGNPVGYLETPDQWVERDTDASNDLLASRLVNISELRQKYIDSNRVVSAKVKEMMKLLRVEDFIEGGVDYNTIYTEEELNDLAN